MGTLYTIANYLVINDPIQERDTSNIALTFGLYELIFVFYKITVKPLEYGHKRTG